MRTGENIYKRKDGRWEARILLGHTGGRASYKSLYAGSYQEAKKRKSVYEEEQEIAEEPVPSEIAEITFGMLAEAWLAENQDGNWRPGTYNKYKNCLGQYILPEWRQKSYRRINQQDYDGLFASLKQNMRASSLYTVNTVLRGIGKYALRQKGIPMNFMVSASHLEKQTARGEKILTEAECGLLTAYVMARPTATNLGFLLSLYEGLRQGEVCALRWKDIDLENRQLYIRETLQRIQTNADTPESPRTVLHLGPPKNGKKRTLPLHSQLLPFLEKGQHDPEDFFLSGTQRPLEPRTFNNRFHRLLDECGLRRVHIHLLRHTFASNSIEAGMDVKALSEILGHTTVKITMDRYVHLSMQYKQSQLDQLHFPAICRQNPGQD